MIFILKQKLEGFQGQKMIIMVSSTNFKLKSIKFMKK